MQILAVAEPAQIEQVRLLFQEYWDSFDFTPCFQNFSQEVAALPGDYAPPGGALALALVQGRPAGCAALRRIDDARGEVKRLYVRSEFRGLGLGKALLDWVIAQARALGYREVVGDTMPVMERALEMYLRYGFQRTGPYAANPTPGAIYIRFRLTS
ncbi:MAG: GCN5-related N-acetyltransferase [Candidatus Solibacter sp.]|nr:GCN5-related N-acetyltransferase [Candidatus Solibacter sp.]